eukprot:263164-Amphidinium_carterae.1
MKSFLALLTAQGLAVLRSDSSQKETALEAWEAALHQHGLSLNADTRRPVLILPPCFPDCLVVLGLLKNKSSSWLHNDDRLCSFFTLAECISTQGIRRPAGFGNQGLMVIKNGDF